MTGFEGQVLSLAKVKSPLPSGEKFSFHAWLIIKEQHYAFKIKWLLRQRAKDQTGKVESSQQLPWGIRPCDESDNLRISLRSGHLEPGVHDIEVTHIYLRKWASKRETQVVAGRSNGGLHVTFWHNFSPSIEWRSLHLRPSPFSFLLFRQEVFNCAHKKTSWNKKHDHQNFLTPLCKKKKWRDFFLSP